LSDIRRIIDIILQELAAAGAVAPARCVCHGFSSDCCPTRVSGVLAAGACRLGLHAAGGGAGEVAGLIDHTLLKPDATAHDIEKLCREAAEFHFATVCVNPTWVAFAHRLLRGSGVGVCSVVGFPLGATTPDVKQYETRRAIFDGASEIDMVLNIGALKSGDLRLVEEDIEAVTTPCREHGVVSKVIIEAALLSDEEKVAASTLTKAAGADFVKTSTGFGPGGATIADVMLMRKVVGDTMGVKAAGGVRDLEQMNAMVAAGATRVGASAGVRIVKEARGEPVVATKPASY
jgi:deoxyribose-phosphate aldolase